MLKKLGLGMVVMIMSAIAWGASSAVNKNDTDFPLDSDPFANVIGYNEAQRGGGFPPAMSQIINQFGKVPVVKFALNNKETVKITRNVSSEKIDGYPTVYIIDTQENKTVVIETEKYEVSYYVSDGYFYGAQIVLKYDSNYSDDEQTKFLGDKVQKYLIDAGFQENYRWFDFPSIDKMSKYEKGGVNVSYAPASKDDVRGLVIRVNNLKLTYAVQDISNQSYNKNLKDKFKEVDNFLK